MVSKVTGEMDEDVSSLQVKRSPSTSISSSLYTQLENVYNNIIVKQYQNSSFLSAYFSDE